MTTTINASTSSGLVNTADTSGILQLQTASTAALTIDANQRTAFVAGTAALPAITTTGDTNTGIFFPAADTIAFSEGGAESMRIDSSGNVGIGTTSPAYKLDVSGVIHNSLSSGNYFLADQGGTNTLFQQIQNSGVTLKIGVENSSGGGIFTGSGSFDAVIGTSSNRNLSFGVFGATKMTLDNAGNLLVGTTSVNFAGSGLTLSTNAGSTKWLVGPISANAGNFYVATSGSTGVYLAGTSATSWSSNSDERLKTDLVPIENATTKVASMRSVTGRYKTDPEGTSRSFLIAQDVQAVLPEAVSASKIAGSDDDTEYLGVAYTEVIPLLVASIKELKAINDTQAELISGQAATINALVTRIEALENRA